MIDPDASLLALLISNFWKKAIAASIVLLVSIGTVFSLYGIYRQIITFREAMLIYSVILVLFVFYFKFVFGGDTPRLITGTALALSAVAAGISVRAVYDQPITHWIEFTSIVILLLGTGALWYYLAMIYDDATGHEQLILALRNIR